MQPSPPPKAGAQQQRQDNDPRRGRPGNYGDPVPPSEPPRLCRLARNGERVIHREAISPRRSADIACRIHRPDLKTVVAAT
jgi:hypothetical protein